MNTLHKTDENMVGVVEDGFFKGRKIFIPEKPTDKWVLIERVDSHFSMACLLHDIWIGNEGCSKCQNNST